MRPGGVLRSPGVPNSGGGAKYRTWQLNQLFDTSGAITIRMKSKLLKAITNGKLPIEKDDLKALRIELEGLKGHDKLGTLAAEALTALTPPPTPRSAPPATPGSAPPPLPLSAMNAPPRSASTPPIRPIDRQQIEILNTSDNVGEGKEAIKILLQRNRYNGDGKAIKEALKRWKGVKDPDFVSLRTQLLDRMREFKSIRLLNRTDKSDAAIAAFIALIKLIDYASDHADIKAAADKWQSADETKNLYAQLIAKLTLPEAEPARSAITTIFDRDALTRSDQEVQKLNQDATRILSISGITVDEVARLKDKQAQLDETEKDLGTARAAFEAEQQRAESLGEAAATLGEENVDLRTLVQAQQDKLAYYADLAKAAHGLTGTLKGLGFEHLAPGYKYPKQRALFTHAVEKIEGDIAALFTGNIEITAENRTTFIRRLTILADWAVRENAPEILPKAYAAIDFITNYEV